MKAIFYCKKIKPYLQVNRCVLPTEYDRYILSEKQYYSAFGEPLDKLNGKIIIECDFEVEKILPINVSEDDYEYGLYSGKNLLKESCLTNYDIYEYLQDDNGGEIFNKGYAIHIKDLYIFEKPRELTYYHNASHLMCVLEEVRNMQYIYDYKGVKKVAGEYVDDFEKKILIPITPQEACNILNRKQSMLVRKDVLKETKNHE